MTASTEDEQRRQWFREQVLPLEPRLHKAALRLTGGDQAAAEDFVHDTLARLLDLAGWRAVENAPAYCLSVLRNQALLAYRRRKIVSIVNADNFDLDLFADDQPGPEQIAQGRDEMQMLLKIVGDLPPQCRRVFTLRKIYGLSPAEIAERLDLSISTVEKHLVKGLAICAGVLGREPVRGNVKAKLGLVGKKAPRSA